MKTTQGELYTRPSKRHGQVYYLRWQADGKRKAKALKDEEGSPITNRRDARKAADKLLAPYRAGDEAERHRALLHGYTDALETARQLEEESRERITLAGAWDLFKDNPERRKCSDVMLQDYHRRWFRFVGWMQEQYPSITTMEGVDRTHAKAFVQELDAGDLSANRRNKIVTGCRMVFSLLAEDCNGMPNPFRNIRNRDLTTHGHRELSEGELLKVCQSAEGELRTLLATGMYTALRLGDACLLRWEDVALHTGRISIIPRKTKRTNKRVNIPLHPVLRTILEETPQADRAGYVVPGLADRYERDAGGVCKIIRRHFEKNDIETQERHPDQKQATCLVGFHSLRHSFVSMCAEKGVPLPVVQELCGHGSPAIQKHYIHLGADAAGQAMEALPSTFGTQDTAPDPLKELADIAATLDEDAKNTLIVYARQLAETTKPQQDTKKIQKKLQKSRETA